jgi:hypothetical protein
VSLPWVRLDSNIASHDKTLKALGMRGGKGAMAVDMFALGWSGGHATDGHIPSYALPAIHATAGDVRILVEVGLWDEDPDGEGWWIHNFGHRQEASTITESKRAKASEAGRRSGCVRRGHPSACTCWKQPPTAVRLVEG